MLLTLRTNVYRMTIIMFLFKSIVDAVLAIRKSDEPVDLHMVEIMQMQHKTDTETK